MARKGRPVDYRRLAAADMSDLSLGDALGTDFRALHSELLSFGGYRNAGTRNLPAAQLTPEWLQQNGAFRPTLIPAAPAAARELGIALPEGSLTVDRLASRLGIATEVHTMDVQTQGEGPRWTLHQWCLYWEARRAASREPPPALAAAGGAAGAGGLASGALTGSLQQPGTAQAGRPAPAEDEADSAAVKRKRTAEEEAAVQHLKGISAESKKRLLEVSALSLTGTALEAEVSPPTAVCAVDLAQQVWPEGAPSRPSTSVNLVMSPEGAYTDFHLAVGGSSVWLHCLSGRRVLALVPPTPRNLATYVAWAASARYAGVFLPAHCEGVVRLEMGPGDTLIIPGGWAHASATTASSVLLGGSFLRRDALALQLEAWRIEDHLAVRPRFRYPAFKQVLWYAAAAFAKRLQRLAGLPGLELKQRVAERLAAMAEEEATAAATRGADSQDSDSVSKAGAAKKKKGWLGLGEQREVADDAGTRRPQQAQQAQQGHETPRPVPAGQRALQPPALGLARAAASPTAAGLPRQVGRAVGGGSRLRTAGGVGGGSRAAARAPAARLNPTQQGIDLRGGGGGGGGGGRRAGGGGGGGGFGQRKRQHSPDSFIEQDSGGEEDSDMAGSDEEAEGVEWAPRRADRQEQEDEEMTEPDTDPDVDELAAAGYRHRYAADDDGQAARPRRMTARQAAAAAKEAAAWDGRLARRAAGGAAYDEFDEEELGDDEEWEGGGGSGGRGRRSTRFRGQMPAHMAALLQEEEAEEAEEAAEAAYLAAPHVSTAAAALAAFEAAAQQQPATAVAPAAAAGAGLKPVKIKVKAPAAPPAEQQQQAVGVQPAAVQHTPASGIKIKIKPAGAAQQAQQPTIPQVDGAGDESGDEAPAAAAAAAGGQDELAAMYDALFDEQPAQQGAAAAQPQVQQEQLPAALASPLGLQARQPPATQQAQQAQQAGSKQEQGQQSEGADLHRNASLAMWLDGGGAGEARQRSQGGAEQPAAGSTGAQAALDAQPAAEPAAEAVQMAAEAVQQQRPRHDSRQLSDSSQGQLAAGGQDSEAAHRSGGSASPSVEGPAASGGAAPAAAGQASPQQQQAQQEQQQQRDQQQQPQPQPPRSGGRAAQEERPAGSSGAPSPADAAGFAAGMAAANGAAAAMAAAQPGAATAAAVAGDEEEEEGWDLDPAAPPAEPLSLEEEEGLAALLAALKDWLRKPHALNDVPLTISNPKAVVARLEVCMRELGLSLTPPPQVDFDSVPLERLLPVRTPRAGGLTGTLASHQTPQTAGGSEFVPGELDAVGELEEGGEFDPDDLEEEGEAPVVEESAGPKRKLVPASAAKPAGLVARAGGSAGRPPGASALAPPAAKRSKASVKERLSKKLGLGKKR